MFRTSWLIFVVLDKKWKRRPETAMTVVVLCSQGTNLSRNREDFWEVAFGEMLATML